MAIDPTALLSFAQTAAMPFAYVVGGVVLGHYVPKAWTVLAAAGSKAKAVYNVGKLMVAQAEAAAAAAVPVTPVVVPPHIEAAVAAAVAPKA